MAVTIHTTAMKVPIAIQRHQNHINRTQGTITVRLAFNFAQINRLTNRYDNTHRRRNRTRHTDTRQHDTNTRRQATRPQRRRCSTRNGRRHRAQRRLPPIRTSFPRYPGNANRRRRHMRTRYHATDRSRRGTTRHRTSANRRMVRQTTRRTRLSAPNRRNRTR